MNPKSVLRRGAERIARAFLDPRDADRLLDALDDEHDRYRSTQGSARLVDLWYTSQVIRSVPAMRPRRHGTIRGDLRHLARRLGRTPYSTLAAVFTLTITIGAGTAIFAVCEVVLLRPLPFQAPEELALLGITRDDEPDAAMRGVSWSTLESWRAASEGLAGIEAFDPTNLTLTGEGTAERLNANDVTPGFLNLLGSNVALGRDFQSDDVDRRIAIVDHDFWRTRLGADPEPLGRRIELGGETHEIVGVLPEAFEFALSRADVWRPMGPPEQTDADAAGALRALARVHPDGSFSSVRTALESRMSTGTQEWAVRVAPLDAAIAGDSARTLTVLAGGASIAVLIAFLNLTVLLLVRALERGPELAVRRAIGAGPTEAYRQLMLESLALVTLGAVGGMTLAAWLTPMVGRFATEFSGVAPRSFEVGRLVASVAAASSILGGGVIGALAARTTIAWSSGAGYHLRHTDSRGSLAVRRTLVSGQLALALVLLVSMSMLLTSLQSMLRTDSGFVADDVLKLQVSLPAAEYPDRASVGSFYTTLNDQLAARLTPDVASIVNEVPLTGDGGRSDVGLPQGEERYEAVLRAALPRYFEVMSIPVTAGDGIGRAQPAGIPRAWVTPSLASRVFGSHEVVGRELWVDDIGGVATVTGVVGEVKHRSLVEQTIPTLYLAAEDAPSTSSIVVVRSRRPASDIAQIVQDVVGSLDPALPVYSVRTMEDVVAASPGVPDRRLLTLTLSTFAALALLLSSIGLFGVAAHDAARRKRELALRAALGADPRAVLRSALVTTTHTLLVGMGAGAMLIPVVAIGLHRLLDPTPVSTVLTSGVAAAAILSFVCATALVPVGLRAATGDPAAALRAD